MKILVTGAAGFIGAAVSTALLKRGDHVVGIDNLNDYYDVNLKKARLKLLEAYQAFTFIKLDISHEGDITKLFQAHEFDVVVNLAAQAGVRHSLTHPRTYINSNVVGFFNIIDACKHAKVGNLVFASSSSVYGANTQRPFSEHHNVDHPLSLYGASKKSNELIAHSYAHLYGLPCTGLRFFSVYGPWGRPDMALFQFTDKILNDESIDVFNYGDMLRDFTYIDDIVEGVLRVIDKPATENTDWSGDDPDPASANAPYRIYNIGNNRPVQLLQFIQTIEACLGKKAKMKKLPMQPGDISSSIADITLLGAERAFKPKTTVNVGVKRFVDWYVDYYEVSF